ncbi:condensation domain-containing protein [Nonomuraea sp. NPDC059023]|uniref:condensation domain-containing protein n=1 Tax=unclassified Nonomuraea TaxID=2593643 RepID=UPI0036D0EF07
MRRAEALFPLSFQQQEMLRNIRAFPACARRYHNSFVFRLTGDVDVDTLAGALEDLAARHPVLSTTLVTRDGADWQRAGDPAGGACRPVIRPVDTGVTLDDITTDLVARRYDAGRLCSGDPLYQPEIYVLKDMVVLAMTIHHVLYDGWSISVLWRDLSECYAARHERRAPSLPELTITYLDYTREQRESWEKSKESVTAYWRAAAAGVPREVDWPGPGDPGAPPFATAAATFEASAEQVDSVRGVSRQARVSPFLVLLSATASALARITGQDRMLAGTDTANREDPSVHDLAGFCLNTRLVPLADPAGRPFPEVLSSVRRHWLAADRHRDAYVDQILHELGRPEVVKVNMMSETLDTTMLRLPGVTSARVPLPMASSYWRPVYSEWRLGPDRFALHLTYQPARVSAKAVEAWIDGVNETLHLLKRVADASFTH